MSLTSSFAGLSRAAQKEAFCGRCLGLPHRRTSADRQPVWSRTWRVYTVPLLTREQEAHLFRKMNYLKYKASSLRERLSSRQPRRRLMAKIEKCYREAVMVRNYIVQANLRLVVSIAKRHLREKEHFFDLISDGNVSLMRHNR